MLVIFCAPSTCVQVAAEAADVLYFAMARCVAAGVSLSQIYSHLDRRTLKLSRRPGNAKAARIKEGDKILAAAAAGRERRAGCADNRKGQVSMRWIIFATATAAATAAALAIAKQRP